MARLSEDEIAGVFGAAKKKDPPGSAAEAAVAGIKALDDKLAAVVEKHRQAGETHEQAYVKMMDESPALFARYEAERQAVLKGAGFGGGVE